MAGNDNTTLEQKTVDMCGFTSAALEKAGAIVDQKAAQQVKLAEMAPRVAKALVDHGRIFPSQQKEAEQKLQDPVLALEILEKVAGHRNDDELGRLGSPDSGEKVASAGGRPDYDPSQSLTTPHVGARTGMLKQSDLNLFAALNLPVPQGE